MVNRIVIIDALKYLERAQINNDCIVLTTKNDIFRELRDKGIRTILIEQTGDVDAETMKTQTDNLNKIIGLSVDKAGLSKKEKRLLAVCSNCYRPISGHLRMIYYNARKIENIIKSAESISAFWDKSNFHLCFTVEEYSHFYNLDISNRFLNPLVAYKYFKFKGSIIIQSFNANVMIGKAIKWIFVALKNAIYTKTPQSYELGECYAEDSLRHFEWLLPRIERLRRFDYRIICMTCPKQYKRMLENNVKADCMENWLSLSILIKNLKRFWHVKKEFKHHISSAVATSPYLVCLVSLANYYIVYEMFWLFLQNAICESYFKWNKFILIEPYSISNYPQTICVANNCGARLFRNYGFTQFMKQEVEAYPDIFRYVFFSEVGINLKQEWDYNKWGGERYLCSVKEIPQYSIWEKNYSKERGPRGDINRRILFTISSNGVWFHTEEECDVLFRTIIDVATKLQHNNIDCRIKVHPAMPASEYQAFQTEIEKMKNCEWYEKSTSIIEAMENVDLVVSDFSTTVIDAFAQRIPVIGLYNSEEKKLASWQEKYVDFIDYSQLYQELIRIEMDYWYYNDEQVARQDGFFNISEKRETVDIYDVLHDKLLEHSEAENAH